MNDLKAEPGAVKWIRRLLFWSGILFLFWYVVVSPIRSDMVQHQDAHRRLHCANNLREVGLGLKMWAMNNGEVYPDKIEECSRYLGHQAALLICPSSGSELVSTRILDNVGAWMDYVYVPGLPESVSPETVIAYCPAKNHKGEGGNVLFGDGPVQWFNTQKHCGEGQTSFEDVIGTIGKEKKP